MGVWGFGVQRFPAVAARQGLVSASHGIGAGGPAGQACRIQGLWLHDYIIRVFGLGGSGLGLRVQDQR